MSVFDTDITSTGFFSIFPPSANLELHCGVQSVRPHPNANSNPARGIGEQCLRWSPGSKGRAFQQLLGSKNLTHAVTGTSWAAPWKHKNKRGSDSTVAGCLGIYSLDCSPGMMVSYSGHCSRCWHDAHSQENCT